MPTKTGDKVRIIVLGTGPDAETARAIAESDADVALAKQFTKTVTHLVIDDTVKTTEARLKKAEEAGVPVLTVAEFRALLVAGPEDEVEEVVEAELEEAPAETPAAVVDPEPAAEAEPEPEPEPVAEAVEPEPVRVEEPEPVVEAEPEPEPVAEAEPEPEPAESKADTAVVEPAAEPAAEAIDEPEEAADDPEKAVPSQAEAPAIENDEKSAKPSLLNKIKSIFGLSAAKK
ncbi:hypothetical protein [Glycomyces sp. YM15]|uniref:hypothetical protein n=1 Tax=Glycomyces sp. YM15 TaxID=2800446 RepID=UPI0019665A21|nr:hypothetical protein [Glycomyces sp. YM15]